MDQDQYHFTIYYDKRNSVTELNELDRNISYTANPVGFKILEEDGPCPALAIIFESKGLYSRFDELSNTFISDYDSYLPHITIKYNPEKEDIEKLRKLFPEIKNNVPVINTTFELWNKSK